MTVTLESAHLTVTVELDRGGEISSVRSVSGANALSYFDWAAPIPDGPSFGATERDWLTKYRAGWQFLFPNSGAESVWGGTAVAFHGEASLAPVRLVEQERTRLTVRTGARLPLELTRSIRLSDDGPTLFVEERVTNVGAETVPFLWGHHPTFPAVPGAHLDMPHAHFDVEPATPGDLRATRGIWPAAVNARSGDDVDLSVIPETDMVRLVYLYGLHEGWAALRNPIGAALPGVAMAWDVEAYPELWIWLQNGDNSFPWYGRARMIGIEPQRYHPFDGLAGAVERNQAVIVGPGETVASWLTMSLLSDHRPVTAMSRSGAVSHA
ncbi:hypothetical protein [Curtobacterium sp. 9128]|uniref:hypothetical protein n=1 Tax=Curtobacterium sp. 9128 TaxID=1793722 RepID=UPI0011AAE902|nr:hypothetical protein [Curtobacterium sp. 9128]